MDFKRSRSSPLYLRGFSHVTSQVFWVEFEDAFSLSSIQWHLERNMWPRACRKSFWIWIDDSYQKDPISTTKKMRAFLCHLRLHPRRMYLDSHWVGWIKSALAWKQSDAQYIQSPSDSSHTYLIHIDTLFPQTLHCHAISWSVLNMLDHFLLVLAEAKEKARLRPWRLKKSIEKTLILSPLSSHASSWVGRQSWGPVHTILGWFKHRWGFFFI